MDRWQVIFDIGGVLVPWDPPAVLRRFYPDAALHEPILAAVYRHADWRALDAGTLDEALALERMAARTGRPLQEMRALMQATRDSLQPIAASWRLVRALHARGVPLFVLSNMPERTFEVLARRIDGWSMFRGLLISGREGLLKPEPAIFERLLTRHGLRAEHCVFIDDMAENVAAARDCGLQAIRFADPAQCARELAAITGWTWHDAEWTDPT